ncbi:MAG: TRAP transporter small permease subunit [Gammaproteobacteria bacterium]
MNNAALIRILTKIATLIEALIEWVGKVVSWVAFAMVILVSYDVAMRYFFRSGSIALQELEWHFFSIIFLIGAAYTLKHDDHVRLDIFYHSRFMEDYQRAWVNVIGSLFMLIPFCLLIISSSWPFIHQSFIYAEASPDPGGLPYRWLIKTAIPIGFTLLLIQGIGDLLKNLVRILEKF